MNNELFVWAENTVRRSTGALVAFILTVQEGLGIPALVGFFQRPMNFADVYRNI